MKLVKMCGHPVSLIRTNGTRIDLPAADRAARVSFRPSQPIGLVDGVLVSGPPIDEAIYGLPPEFDDRMLIVSQMTALAVARLLPGRGDIVFPGTARCYQPIRADTGQIDAAVRLVRAI